MIKEITNIIFTKKDPFSIDDYFEIEMMEDKNIIKWKNSINKQETISISDTYIIRFLDSFFRIIEEWDENYIQINTLDRTQWHLTIKFKNGNNKQYYGSGLYPNNFNAFEKLKKELIISVRESNI